MLLIRPQPTTITTSIAWTKPAIVEMAIFLEVVPSRSAASNRHDASETVRSALDSGWGT
jgi:hypothetical protein